MTGPTIGRIIHYVAGDTCRPAIVVHCPHEAVLDLSVFTPDGVRYCPLVPQDEPRHSLADPVQMPARGTWHWPCVRT